MCLSPAPHTSPYYLLCKMDHFWGQDRNGLIYHLIFYKLKASEGHSASVWVHAGGVLRGSSDDSEGRHLALAMSSRTQRRQSCLEGERVCRALQKKLENSRRQPGAIPKYSVRYGPGFRGQTHQVLPRPILGASYRSYLRANSLPFALAMFLVHCFSF